MFWIPASCCNNRKDGSSKIAKIHKTKLPFGALAKRGCSNGINKTNPKIERGVNHVEAVIPILRPNTRVLY